MSGRDKQPHSVAAGFLVGAARLAELTSAFLSYRRRPRPRLALGRVCTDETARFASPCGVGASGQCDALPVSFLPRCR